MNLKNPPIMNFHRLAVSPQNQAAFVKAGNTNMFKSIEADGTLFMFSAKSKQSNDNYVVECYKDEKAYEDHLASSQFKDFKKATQDLVIENDSFPLTPIFAGTNYQNLRIKSDNNYLVNIAKITLVDFDREAFAKIVKHEMTVSMQEEPGVIAMFAGYLFDVENEWRFFEVYKDESAYQKHVQTDNFKDYVQKTQEMFYQKEILQLHGDIIVDKANINYEK